MDGVIVDSEPLHEKAFLEVFQQMGFGDTHGIHFPSYFGRSDATLWRDFVECHRPSQPIEELLLWKQRVFLDILRRAQPIFPPIPALIQELAGRYQLAVASGSLHVVIDEVLSMQGLVRHFGVRVSAQDVERGKPAPDIFLRAANRLGVAPRHCCVIEDSAAGVQAALAAGMEVIAITNSLPARELAAATHVVSEYAEIERLLAST